ncbi:hypothetical protein V1512DRAFT_253163 [Lipomyces arxii]|uniref:uncharacterized protein n=1 Tax=Lipomyces arxii TaxID=56418 RepID=UPI0034CFC7A3
MDDFERSEQAIMDEKAALVASEQAVHDIGVGRGYYDRSKSQMSMSRRIALAGLPPVTPVTTRSKERAASAVNVESRDEDEEDGGEGGVKVELDLATNTDYIALTSTLELLNSQRENAARDIATLQRLKSGAVEDPGSFIEKLRSEGRVEGAPGMQSIVRAPVVKWNKYGISNEMLEKEVERGVVERDARFGSVRVFGEAKGVRKASV